MFLQGIAYFTFFHLVKGHSFNSRCRSIPGDDGWPGEDKWANLNSTVEGRLIATVPAASICHGSTYDATACETLKQEWNFPQAHISNSAEIMNPYWQNGTCDPFTPSTIPCTLGNYASYSINVSCAADIQAGIAFAKENNIRLVIKNTGHDYFGKSTGTGSLALWTHNLNTTTFIPSYTSTSYTGPALRIGAGVLAGDAYLAAHKHNHRVVGGSYARHGSRQCLEWEVITAAGEHVHVSESENEELYWALSGGGGGTFGVVVSMTVRAYRDDGVGGAYLSFEAEEGEEEVFWKGVEVFVGCWEGIVEKGAVVVAHMMKKGSFSIVLTAPGLTEQEVVALLEPLTSGLDALAMVYRFVPTYSPDFYSHFAATFGPLPWGPIPVSDMVSSRLIPRSVAISYPKGLLDSLKMVLESGHFYIGLVVMNVDKPQAENAVHPAFRQAIAQCLVGAPWDWTIPRAEMLERRSKLLESIMPALEAMTPGSGTYLNEGDIGQVDWQKKFYGDNWKRLSKIKKQFDPTGVFYGATAVGSEEWMVDGDGRLCQMGVHEHSEL